MNFLLNLLIPMHVAHPYIRNHFCSMHPCGFPRLQSNLQASEGEQFYCNLQASEESRCAMQKGQQPKLRVVGFFN